MADTLGWNMLAPKKDMPVSLEAVAQPVEASAEALQRKVTQCEQLLCAQSAREALQLLSTEEYDLAILDEIYGNENQDALTGLDVTRAIREAREGGLTHLRDRAAAGLLGGSCFLLTRRSSRCRRGS